MLLAVFGASLAVAIPFLVAAGTIAATLTVVYALAHAVPMVTYVTNLVELIGLALAIDYSLLIVHRFREELEGHGSVDDAVVRTIATAGRAVVASGLAVAAGLGLLLFLPVPLLRSMGVGGLLIPLASIAAALTLQPALLGLLGRRAFRPRRATGRARALGAARALDHAPAARLPARGRRPAPGRRGTAREARADLRLVLRPPASPEAMRGYALLRDRVGRGR